MRDIGDLGPADKHYFTLLTLFSYKLAYYTMLFMLALNCTAGSGAHLKNKQHAQTSQLWQ